MEKVRKTTKVIDRIGGYIYEPIDNDYKEGWFDRVLTQAREDYNNKVKILYKGNTIEIVEK